MASFRSSQHKNIFKEEDACLDMRTFSNKDKIYIGRRAGKEIFSTIKNAKKSVKIVSPYLSPSYLEELVRLSEKGIKITLITSDELEEGGIHSTFKHSDVIKQKKILNPKAKSRKRKFSDISLITFIIAAVSLVLSFLIGFLLFISVLLIIICLVLFIYSSFIKIYTYNYYSIFRLRVFDSKSGEKPWSTNLIHSKIYVIDEKVAFLGSSNFTYSGFNIHYETVIKVEDPEAIKDISQEVEALFNSTGLTYKKIDEWGREIYE